MLHNADISWLVISIMGEYPNYIMSCSVWCDSIADKSVGCDGMSLLCQIVNQNHLDCKTPKNIVQEIGADFIL